MERKNLKLKNRLNISMLKEITPQDHSPVEIPLDYSGFIIVRLSSELPQPSEGSDTLSAAAKDLSLTGLEKILKEFDLSVTRRLVRSLAPKTVLELEYSASKSELPPLHSLTAYWRVDARKQADQIEVLVKRLNGLYEVDLAYKEFVVTDPVVNATNDPYNADQDYLDAAPTGINARWAWTQPNGEGAGVGFVDLEQGWFPNHEDFASKI